VYFDPGMSMQQFDPGAGPSLLIMSRFSEQMCSLSISIKVIVIKRSAGSANNFHSLDFLSALQKWWKMRILTPGFDRPAISNRPEFRLPPTE
jgi:hypothetical protein